jgi:hypothetical protein
VRTIACAEANAERDRTKQDHQPSVLTKRYRILKTDNMKRLTFATIFCILLFNISYAQQPEKYAELVNEAWSLYESQDYLKSAKKYSEAFAAADGTGSANDRYNAACSWALAGQPDSAFVQLFKIAENGNYTNLGHITTDTDLNSLHGDERWNRVIEIVKANKEKAEANFDKPLVAMLDTIYQEDQKYRHQIKEIEEKYGWDSHQMRTHWEMIIEKDSINLVKVTKILDERGWLGEDVIGHQGNTTLFLVIQHADLETQEKYLPMMREAVIKGNASASHLALLEDRVALDKGEKQTYGSQIGLDQKTGAYYVLPLIDPDNVDERRAEVGLGPLADYISNWGLTWDVEEYKKKLPAYEREQKRQQRLIQKQQTKKQR